MNITSLIVEIEPGTSEAVLYSLALLERVTVYGIKDERIVLVLEDESPADIEQHVKQIEAIQHVSGISPVYSLNE
jgi:nitrate reductase NapAB chaperone NapD